jgi:anthranilate phosphoribosyltransferase
VDVCGTGGDSSGTINISTAAAIVLAEMGVPVAKHGNRSVSSKCGSADLLEAFGVKLDPEPVTARKCLDEVGICFLFAPQYHGGLRHAMPVRKALKMRTIFNILGPLANPAKPPVQLMGVYDPALVIPIANTLSRLGAKRSLVVHGSGLDEISISATTVAAISNNGTVEEIEITPEDAGLQRFDQEALAGGDAEENRIMIEALLAGKGSPAHEAAVAINAGAAAWIAGAASSLKEGTQAALDAIRSGKSVERVKQWAELSHGS